MAWAHGPMGPWTQPMGPWAHVPVGSWAMDPCAHGAHAHLAQGSGPWAGPMGTVLRFQGQVMLLKVRVKSNSLFSILGSDLTVRMYMRGLIRQVWLCASRPDNYTVGFPRAKRS